MARKRKSKVVEKPKPQNSEFFEEKRFFRNPKLINDHLTCPICKDVFEEPFRLTCGHSFCKECIDMCLKHSPYCPIDRSKVELKYCHKDFLTANIIGELKIACPWRPFGCSELDKYSIIKDHKESCVFNINKMDSVMQEKMLEEYHRKQDEMNEKIKMNKDTGPSPPKRSALDEILATMNSDNEAEDEDEQDPDTSLSRIPEPDVLPLSLRLYINSGDDVNKDLLRSIIQK